MAWGGGPSNSGGLENFLKKISGTVVLIRDLRVMNRNNDNRQETKIYFHIGP